MTKLPRSEWIEWCERVSNEPAFHLETLEPSHLRILHIDYAPFDDILEMDIQETDAVRRRLIDHPQHIYVDDPSAGGGMLVFIESPDEFISLIAAVSDGS